MTSCIIPPLLLASLPISLAENHLTGDIFSLVLDLRFDLFSLPVDFPLSLGVFFQEISNLMVNWMYYYYYYNNPEGFSDFRCCD